MLLENDSRKMLYFGHVMRKDSLENGSIHLYTVRWGNDSNTTFRWNFSHKDCFRNSCSPRKFSRILKSEDKDKDLQISPRGSSRILEDKDFPRGQQHCVILALFISVLTKLCVIRINS